MKRLSIFAAIFLVFLLLVPLCSAQESDLVRFDEATPPNCEYIAAVVDRLAAEINDKNLQGYVVIYTGPDPVKNAFLINYVSLYKKFRRFDDRIYQRIVAAGHGSPKVEFWVSKNGAKPNVKEVPIDYKLTESAEPIHFVDDLLEIVKINGKVTELSVGCDACCIESINYYLLSRFLETNPKTKAYFIVRGRSRGAAKRLEQIIRDVIKETEIDPNQIRMLYAGRNKINDQKFFEVEVFLSSKEIKSPEDFPYKFADLN